ncbi:MAG: hypothetical protein ACREJQ_01260 [bacterium]
MKFGVSYFGNRMVRHAAGDLQNLKKAGFSFVVHTYSENDLLFYSGTMKELVVKSRDLGLATWLDPWGVGRVFGGEAFSYWTSRFPEICQQDRAGKPVPAACPNHPKFRKLMLGWLDAAAEIGAPWVFWDEPHFFTSAFIPYARKPAVCFCKFCEEQRGMQSREAFKADSIADFLRYLTLHAAARGLKNAVCLLPPEIDRQDINWERVAADPNLDSLGADPYWMLVNRKPQEYVSQYTDKLRTLAAPRNIETHLWIQGFKVPKGREKEIPMAVKAAVESGVSAVAFWGFDACAHMSSIRPDDARTTWQAILSSVTPYAD